ncbi:hypothetical protein ABIF97_004050 [Bradyrhizobium japonicum]
MRTQSGTSIIGKNLCPLFRRIVNLSHALVGHRQLGHRPDVCCRLQTVTDAELSYCRTERFDEGTVDASLYIDAVSDQAVLTRRGKFGGDSSLDGLLNIDVIKDEKRRMSTQLKDTFLIVSDAPSRSRRPTSVDPVNERARTLESRSRGAESSIGSPTTT